VSRVIKSIVRVAVPVIVALIPGAGPLAVAVSSAVATAATGGSFKESLISGATAFVGAKIGQSLQGTFEGLGTGVGEATGLTVADVGPLATGSVPATGLSTLAQVAPAGVSQFGTAAADLFGAPTAFDVFNSLGQKTLGELAGKSVGAFTGMTLESALNSGLEGLDEALEQTGFKPDAIVALKQEARNSLAQGAFTNISGATPKIPGLSDEEFNKIIASGVERLNTSLGPSTTAQAFQAAFGEPPDVLGQKFLTEERDLRRQAFTGEVEKAFPKDFGKDIFAPTLTDDAASRILGEQRSGVESGIGAAQARGNLNPTGGATARQFLEKETDRARSSLDELANVFRQQSISGTESIAGRAGQAARTFELGQPQFDVTPFKEESERFVTQRTEPGFVEKSIRDILGGQQLFDLRKTVNEGGSVQGLVSGPPQKGVLLDQLLARQGASQNRRRGLGVSGSGVF